MMNWSIPENTHYYVLLFLFTLLFVLQIWAIVKIKTIIRRVLEIYNQIAHVRSSPKAVRQLQAGSPRPSCQLCRHRRTFLDPSGKSVFVYRCGLSDLSIQLDDYCHKFEYDPQSADI